MDDLLQYERSLRVALARLMEIAVAPQTLDAKLAAALTAILDTSGWAFLSRGCIFLADEPGNCLHKVAAHNLPAGQGHDCTIIPLGHCLCGRAAEERRVIYLEQSDNRLHPHGHYCAPILSGQILLGVLNVFTAPNRQVDEAELSFLAAVTHGLALLIENHRRAEGLTAQRDLLGKILDNIPLRVFWKDRHSVYRGCNSSFARDAGIAVPAAIVGRRDEELPGRSQEADVYRRRDQRVVDSGQPLLDYEELRRFADGREAMIVGSLLPLQLGDGTVDGVVGVYGDVTEQRDTESRLRLLTLNDQLTGLPNQVLFKDRLEQAVIAAGHGQRILGLICLDIDNFQKVNNTFGHAVGDEVLCLVGERLQQTLFNTDTLGRMGGDIFVLLLRDLGQKGDIALVLRRLRLALAQPLGVAGHEVFVTASLGVALYPDDGDDAATLLKNANTALHKAKQSGRNGYQLYSPAMNASALMRLSLEGQLRKALELQQLEVYFQPQIDARSGRLVGAEALLRWCHPELGMVAPGDFIPLAEETGMIVDIGAWVINEACVKVQEWRAQGLRLERVAVNLSPLQFRHHDLVTTVCSALLDSGLDPSLLELEITESAVMHDVDKAADILRYFREMGVRVAIDDFGTGYSSLSLLKKFPITMLKIDQAFIHGTEQHEDDRAIVTAIIVMGHQLGLKVLAEGVESEAQRAFLRESGCDELQGYLFSRPLPLAQFQEYLAGHLEGH